MEKDFNIYTLKQAHELADKFKKFMTPDQLLEMAKKGMAPHYILTNPLTNEKRIYFRPGEITTWIRWQWFVYEKGEKGIGDTYKFYFFSETEMGISDRIEVPPDLASVKNLYHLPLGNITTPSGCYFLCHESKVVYVGQAQNVAGRVVTHHSEGMKIFDQVFFVQVPRHRLNEIERGLIKLYQPKYNKTGLKAATDEEMQKVNDYCFNSQSNP